MKDLVLLLSAAILTSCSQHTETAGSTVSIPKEIIDLGALVTEDLPERVWGKRFLEEYGFLRPNSFEEIHWEMGPISGVNSYYTLFNHGGPHVDAPKHLGLRGGVDSYPVESFAGPLKVFDFSDLETGRTITPEMFEGKDIRPGDIVIIYTGYTPPETDQDLPETVTLTREAAEYLANIPVRAFGTEAWSVANLQDKTPAVADSELARAIPAHHSFLSRGIPLYESLFNVDRLLGKENMYFVGVPLNIKGGDGMMVRPVVLVY